MTVAALETAGYLHPDYAAALSEFGVPRALPQCGGWVLERAIPDAGGRDAMGCYPLFLCQDWSWLPHDLDALEGHLVSLSVVTDPFGPTGVSFLESCFRDTVRPFKEHYVVELRKSPASFVSAHHRHNSQKALGRIAVEVHEEPFHLLEEWNTLYLNLIERHRIRGLSAFSKHSFSSQMRVPGAVALRAVFEGAPVGMTLWYVCHDRAYYHLGAYNARGYELGASFGLFWRAIEHFSAMGLRWLALGGGAGAESHRSGGLTRFKKGWATDVRTTYFCGRILDPGRYRTLTLRRRAEGATYFPAYRDGEFA